LIFFLLKNQLNSSRRQKDKIKEKKGNADLKKYSEKLKGFNALKEACLKKVPILY